MQWKCNFFLNDNIALFLFIIFRAGKYGKLNWTRTPEENSSIFCEANAHELHHSIFIASFNIFLSVSASLENVLILIALHKTNEIKRARRASAILSVVFEKFTSVDLPKLHEKIMWLLVNNTHTKIYTASWCQICRRIRTLTFDSFLRFGVSGVCKSRY